MFAKYKYKILLQFDRLLRLTKLIKPKENTHSTLKKKIVIVLIFLILKVFSIILEFLEVFLSFLCGFVIISVLMKVILVV